MDNGQLGGAEEKGKRESVDARAKSRHKEGHKYGVLTAVLLFFMMAVVVIILAWLGRDDQRPEDVTTVIPTQTWTPTSTPTFTLTQTDTPTATDIPLPTPTATVSSTPRPTVIPTATPTPTAKATFTHTPTVTSTATVTHTPTVTPTTAQRATLTPTLRWLPAPELLAPSNGERFVGWNAEVVLRWSVVPGMQKDEYYVVRIPYDQIGNVAEFWREETIFRVPSNYSLSSVGFPDRHYNWTVEVMRCTTACSQVLNDNVPKRGVAVGERSREGIFYWDSDNGDGGGPQVAPTNTPASPFAP